MIGKRKKKDDSNKLDVTTKEILFRDIKEADINAQKMNDKDFKRLVDNIRRDGCLTSSPLVCEREGEFICISGHHRIRAAIKAGIEKAVCFVAKDIDESTRIRLQLSHNDIHGEPDKELVSLLINSLNEIDLSLVDSQGIDKMTDEIKEIDVSVPSFSYINICLLDQSKEDLVDMITNLEKSEAENWLIEKEQYKEVVDLLTYAFDRGFKTPGQAFGKFLDIIKENKELIKR